MLRFKTDTLWQNVRGNHIFNVTLYGPRAKLSLFFFFLYEKWMIEWSKGVNVLAELQYGKLEPAISHSAEMALQETTIINH